ncbi:MAG TPA: LysE family translocator [bacterium]|nr:LysE family translocator [bacterium]
MITEQVVAFLLFAVVAAVTPGPSNIMLTAVGAHAGVRKGLQCLSGVATGVGAMMFLVPLGLGTLILQHPLVLKILNWGGAAGLLCLSWNIATSSTHIDSVSAQAPVGYLTAALFQWVNPKAWLVSASAAGTFLRSGAGSPVVQAASLGGLFVLAALPSGFLWLAFGASFHQVLRGPRRLRIFNACMGALLVLSIALIIW